MVGIEIFHGNPYDDHTLPVVIEDVRQGIGWLPKEVYCDSGYRGPRHIGETTVHIVGTSPGIKRLSRAERKWRRERCAIFRRNS